MPDHNYWNTFLGADIGLVDPDTDAIISYEEERQARKLIMIPSESSSPWAVRQALGLPMGWEPQGLLLMGSDLILVRENPG